MIYFDNGSTSFPKAPGVAEAVGEFLQNGAFNINRGNYQEAYDLEERCWKPEKCCYHSFMQKNMQKRSSHLVLLIH